MIDAMKIPKFDLLGLGILNAIAKGYTWSKFMGFRSPHSLPDRQEVYDMIAQATPSVCFKSKAELR